MFKDVFARFPKLQALGATVHPENLSSQRLAERLGMAHHGQFKHGQVCPNLEGGRRSDMLFYRINRTDG
jgi:RimJ/RimL family protein N-acetyltransferase